jgi:dipeptidyl aminopeptidase/acylaminoacyl peptidase
MSQILRTLGFAMCAMASGVCLAQQPASESGLIPAERFFGAAAIEETALSPSGRWLAMRTGLGGKRVGLVVFDLKEWGAVAQAARYTDADINTFQWVNDDRLVYSLTDRQRGSGDQIAAPGLFSVHRDGTQTRTLVKLNRPFMSNTARIGREPLEHNHVLLHVPGGGGDEVIVGEIQLDSSGDFSGLFAKRLNVVNGIAVSLSQGAPNAAARWLFDAKGEPRVIVTQRAGRQGVYWRGPDATEWRKLGEFDRYEVPYQPRFIDSSGALFVMADNVDTGNAELTRLDLATGKPEAEAIVTAPGFDFSGHVVSETQGGPTLGYRVQTDAETTVWTDARLRELQTEADRRLPGSVNRLSCRRCDADDMTVIVTSWSDTDPGQVWAYFAPTKHWRKVGDVRPAIDPKRMGQTDFHRMKARDGLELPVWITRPAGAGKEPLPAVVLVHGGPWVRGRHWRWDAEVQFLASRGYVVIEPEFRGSTGYGHKLFRAGWRQWGQAMQDDLADALGWAIGQGWVDPKRACIAGASYGGYATLMGLIRHPDLYRCGAAWVAVTDPRLRYEWSFQSDSTAEVREHDLPKLVGDPVRDAAMLNSVTPVLHAKDIKAPLLLAFGGSDRRVPPVHGTAMRNALIAVGRPPDWVFYPDEGHGWHKLETRLDFAQRLEAFLARHLK